MWVGCVLLVLAAALHSADCSIGGGDTWVAMACGRYTLGPWAKEHPHRTWQMKALDALGVHVTWHDPFGAYTRPYDPADRGAIGWVNQNWLTHVLFYKMKTAFGGDEYGPQKGEFLIVVYKFLQAILTAVFAYWAARVLGAHPLLAAGAVAFGMLLSRSFIDLRPNVSSILFAAIMILLLAYWRQGHPRALLGMFPLMVIWSNVHGGFIYAIMIFMIAMGAHLVQKLFWLSWPDRFVAVSKRALWYLFAGLLMVWIIPAVFSPYGGENLLHPLIIATGQEGKEWREVVEWKPIWDRLGFGNAEPYKYFLGLFLAVFVAWWVWFCRRPPVEAPRRRRGREAEPTCWPKIDLAHLGIIAITTLMSILSRRFIFLGGVVLAPFLAEMTQQLINMVRLRRQSPQSLATGPLGPLPLRPAIVLAVLVLVPAGLIGREFHRYMDTTYHYIDKIQDEDEGSTLFRRMVGISAQPVKAMDFFRRCGFAGIVFNEWTHGGYDAFHQRPDPATGEPPSKVYIDGRAQAAYTIEHYKKWMSIRFTARTGLAILSGGRRVKVSPAMFSQMLTGEGISSAVLDLSVVESQGQLSGVKGYDVYRMLTKSKLWQTVYRDPRYIILLAKDDSRNQEFLQQVRRALSERQPAPVEP